MEELPEQEWIVRMLKKDIEMHIQIIQKLMHKFEKALQMPNLNEDENAYFREKFYYNIRDGELKHEEGRQTRGNPSRHRLFFKKKK